jgi:hypothetical protein
MTAVSCELQIHSGGTFQTSGYLTNGFAVASGPTPVADVPTTFIPCSHNTSVTNIAPGVSGSFIVHNPSASAIHGVEGVFSYPLSGLGAGGFVVGGWWNTTGVIDGFQLLFSTGNITSGTVKIYGRL